MLLLLLFLDDISKSASCKKSTFLFGTWLFVTVFLDGIGGKGGGILPLDAIGGIGGKGGGLVGMIGAGWTNGLDGSKES